MPRNAADGYGTLLGAPHHRKVLCTRPTSAPVARVFNNSDRGHRGHRGRAPSPPLDRHICLPGRLASHDAQPRTQSQTHLYQPRQTRRSRYGAVESHSGEYEGRDFQRVSSCSADRYNGSGVGCRRGIYLSDEGPDYYWHYD